MTNIKGIHYYFITYIFPLEFVLFTAYKKIQLFLFNFYLYYEVDSTKFGSEEKIMFSIDL